MNPGDIVKVNDNGPFWHYHRFAGLTGKVESVRTTQFTGKIIAQVKWDDGISARHYTDNLELIRTI